MIADRNHPERVVRLDDDDDLPPGRGYDPPYTTEDFGDTGPCERCGGSGEDPDPGAAGERGACGKCGVPRIPRHRVTPPQPSDQRVEVVARYLVDLFPDDEPEWLEGEARVIVDLLAKLDQDTRGNNGE